MRRVARICQFAFLLMTACMLGCGGGGALPRSDLSGAATFDGKPIVHGAVQFVPDLKTGEPGTAGSAIIVDGKYDTATEGGQGIQAGAYKVYVTAYESRPPEIADETVETKPAQPIFFRFELKATIEPPTYDIAVPAEAKGFNPAKQAAKANDV